MSVFSKRIGLGIAASLAIPTAVLAGDPVVVDGLNIPTEFGAGSLVYSQRFNTNFGDDIDSTQFGGGSELDALYILQRGTQLYLGITGNLENNGNCLVIYFDTPSGAGENPLFTRTAANAPIPGLPRCLAGNATNGGIDGVTFDAGFSPNLAISLTGGSPIGSQTRSYYLANLTTFVAPRNHTNRILGLVTAGDPVASGTKAGTLSDFWPGSDPTDFLIAVDNTNFDGVSGGTGLAAVTTAATKGIEMRISLGQLGATSNDPIRIFAWVSGSDGFVSNQLVPSVDAPDATLDNIGNPQFGSPATAFDLTLRTGQQWLSYTTRCVGDLTAPAGTGSEDLGQLLSGWQTNNAGDLDGDGDTDSSDLGILLGDWNCVQAP